MSLRLPPQQAVNALQDLKDDEVNAWAIDLAKHYDKLYACGAE